MFKKRFVSSLLLGALIMSQSALSAEPVKMSEPAPAAKESMFMGPSFHLALGIRMKKAPDLDTYYSTIGGLKVSLFGIQAGQQAYISFIAPGLQYERNGVFVPSITPVIFNHNFGIGVGFDFYAVRSDRRGGPVGMSVNFDIIKIAAAVGSFTK